MNHPIKFLDRYNKTKLVPVFISYFLELYQKKINFNLKMCHSYNRYNLSTL